MSHSEDILQQGELFPGGPEKPFRIQGHLRNYSWPLCLQWLEFEGKTRFGKHFRLYNSDHSLIYKLTIYFIQDKQEAQRLNLDLKKGILLTGPIGSGKTSLMKLFSNFPGTPGYQFRSCRQLATAFMKLGFELIESYSNSNSAICFDDLGTEQSLKYYGNDTNVLGEILLSRYEKFADHHIKTHCTTNLNASELEAAYGNRLRSRLRESFNLLTLESNDKRV
tara:strand:+ start:765 stop:1430 length:666 start_codon:yes stop_codon:yes gene_type:complete